MENKKNIKSLIEQEETYLNNLLEPKDINSFKGMVDELRDTWDKKQVFRTETEARFSVLQDNNHPTKAAKYWQCVKEQSVFLENLMTLSFDYRRNSAEIKLLEKKLKEEKDEYKLECLQIDLDEKQYNKASMELIAKDRMREIKMWSKLKKEFNDGTFDDQDHNQHQLESYHEVYKHKVSTLTSGSSQAEVFNAVGQLHSIERIKKSGELENNTEKKEQITQHGKTNS
jgi:hypothetical protein